MIQFTNVTSSDLLRFKSKENYILKVFVIKVVIKMPIKGSEMNKTTSSCNMYSNVDLAGLGRYSETPS